MRPTTEELEQLVSFMHGRCGRKMTMIEVGSYQGESMEAFATTKQLKTIVCIDPWKQGYDGNDIASMSDMDEVEKQFDRRASAANDLAEVIKFKGTLDDFIKTDLFKKLDGQFDFTYVDACHTYEGCKHDIEVCKQFIRPKIAFAGHDYVDGWAGVKNAVDEQLGKPDIVLADGSWIKYI